MGSIKTALIVLLKSGVMNTSGDLFNLIAEFLLLDGFGQDIEAGSTVTTVGKRRLPRRTRSIVCFRGRLPVDLSEH